MKSQLCIYIILICISLQLHTTTALDKQYLQLINMTSVNATDPYPATSEKEYFCRNAFQVDLRNESNFLVGLCRPNNFQAVSSSSVIGTLPTDILVADPPYDYNLPMNEQYGNASMPAPSTAVDQYSWDGIRTSTQINFPEHLIQTPDGNIVYFIDIRSCLRKINRTTGQVTTVIGVCLNGTLGISGTADMNAYGVVYFEKEGRRIFVFTVTNFGIYVCYEETPGQEDYVCKQAIEYRFISERVAINARMLTRGVDNYVWQKVRFGLNRYDFTEIFDNLTGTFNKLTYDNDTFVHYISVHSVEAVEPYAWYKNTTQDLGLSDATISFSSDVETMLIIDSIDDGLYFIDTDASDGIDHVIEYCELDLNVATGEDNIDSCTFTDVIGGLWVEDKGQVIVTEKDPGVIRIAEFPVPPTLNTTATTTTISTTTSTTITAATATTTISADTTATNASSKSTTTAPTYTTTAAPTNTTTTAPTNTTISAPTNTTTTAPCTSTTVAANAPTATTADRDVPVSDIPFTTNTSDAASTICTPTTAAAPIGHKAQNGYTLGQMIAASTGWILFVTFMVITAVLHKVKPHGHCLCCLVHYLICPKPASLDPPSSDVKKTIEDSKLNDSTSHDQTDKGQIKAEDDTELGQTQQKGEVKANTEVSEEESKKKPKSKKAKKKDTATELPVVRNSRHYLHNNSVEPIKHT